MAIKKFKETEEDEIVRKNIQREVKMLRILKNKNIDKLILGTMMEKPSLTGSTYYDALSKQDEGSVVSALIDYLFGRGKNVQP